MALSHIEVVSIPVRDQGAAIAFYQGKLGFRLVNDSVFGEGMRWVQFAVSDDMRTTIALVTWFDKMPPGSAQGLVIGTDDIEADRQRLLDAGVEVEPIMDTPWGRFAGFADPDGNTWQLRQG